MTLIKNRQIVTTDTWQLVSDDAELPAGGDVVVSLERFEKERATLLERDGKLGVALKPESRPESLAQDHDKLALITVEFPKFTDGRGYTIARLLRERVGYQGELRAVGNVLRDQLFYMFRVGFDAFDLQEGKDAQGALDAFADFSVTYQGAADDPRPLFRRGIRG